MTLTYGCSTASSLKKEFGADRNDIGSSCHGEFFVSNEANEKLCVARSRINPDRYLIYQDAAEVWRDKLLNILSFGLNIIYDGIADDTPEQWYKAADQYVRKYYGANSHLVRFRRVEEMGSYVDAYTFEVRGGDQRRLRKKSDEKSDVEVKTEILDAPSKTNNR